MSDSYQSQLNVSKFVALGIMECKNRNGATSAQRQLNAANPWKADQMNDKPSSFEVWRSSASSSPN